jgi:hypothetical protein
LLIKYCCLIQNEMTFLRVRTKKHEIMIAPGNKGKYAK